MWSCVFWQVEGDGAEPTSGSDRLAPDDDDAGTTSKLDFTDKLSPFWIDDT